MKGRPIIPNISRWIFASSILMLITYDGFVWAIQSDKAWGCKHGIEDFRFITHVDRRWKDVQKREYQDRINTFRQKCDEIRPPDKHGPCTKFIRHLISWHYASSYFFSVPIGPCTRKELFLLLSEQMRLLNLGCLHQGYAPYQVQQWLRRLKSSALFDL